MFNAGTDTASAAIVWTMMELIRNSSIMRKVQQEVQETAKGKQKVKESELPKLTYLRSVIKEVLRLHPPPPSSPFTITKSNNRSPQNKGV